MRLVGKPDIRISFSLNDKEDELFQIFNGSSECEDVKTDGNVNVEHLDTTSNKTLSELSANIKVRLKIHKP